MLHGVSYEMYVAELRSGWQILSNILPNAHLWPPEKFAGRSITRLAMSLDRYQPHCFESIISTLIPLLIHANSESINCLSLFSFF